MLLYTTENLKNIYLNPYVDMIFQEEGTICRNKLNNMTIAVKVNESVFKKIMKGITHEELIDCLVQAGIEKEESVSLVKILFQKGVIE